MIVKTDRNEIVKIGGKTKPLSIIDHGPDAGEYRYHVPGYRFIHTTQKFSGSFGWKVCGDYEVIEN